jgi:biopolymer transport protein ExbD
LRFHERKRHKPPAIIIISLIDILIVLLIFMMVTTTFKHKSVLNLSLPQSRAQSSAQTETGNITISITKDEPFYTGTKHPSTENELEARLKQVAQENPDMTVIVKPDKDSTTGHLVFVMDAANAVDLNNIKLRTKASQL